MSDIHAQTAYVRTAMLPQAAPPVRETGAVKWVRENLFSSWLNIILTLASIWFVWTVVSHLFPWFYNSIWRAKSLTECRAIRDATLGPDASAACFAVITDRWKQLLFGFYPSSEYWRPTLSLVLLVVGILPMLFTTLPRKLLWGTLALPFVLFFLLWGGSIWTTVMVAAGFVLGFAAIKILTPIGGAILAAIGAVLIPILFWIYAAGPLAESLHSILPIGLEFVQSKDFGGFMVSTVIGVAGIALSLPLGIVLALGRKSDLFIVNKLSTAFIEIIRGVPLIVWLFTASLLLNYFLPPGTNFDLLLRVIIMVTLFSAAYIAEVVRGGLAALPKGQYEGADSLGLSYWQSMQLIVLPQALKISIPGIVNSFIGLFKDTTLVVFIGILDPIGLTNSIRASTDWNGIYWELYVFIGLMFFIFCFSMGRYSLYLEKKLQREHR